MAFKESELKDFFFPLCCEKVTDIGLFCVIFIKHR